jgi:hypothetical protein
MARVASASRPPVGTWESTSRVYITVPRDVCKSRTDIPRAAKRVAAQPCTGNFKIIVVMCVENMKSTRTSYLM